MAFAQSVHNQSSVLKINLMVVDDDPVFLEIMSRMLEKSKYRDPSVMEVTVIAAKDSQEALSTLKVQRNDIDLIITDYYMPGMNGLQLKKKITEEFGHFPVIVISADANIEQESLTSGALCFLPKPIKPCDLPKIYESALVCKINGKSILLTENNQNGNVPHTTQLLPEQAKVMKTKKKIGSCVRTDGSRKNRKRLNVDVDVDVDDDDDDDDDDASPSESKKRKITWNDNLHDLFLRAIRHIGLDKAVPKKILEYMNIPYLTRENVASHLQKYRMFLRKVAAQGLQCTSMESIFSHGHIREPYLNYYRPSTSWYDSSLNNRSFYTKPAGHGFGQSRLLSTTREPVRFNQMASYNFMNRSITYEPNLMRSNVTFPMTNSNLNFSNQPSQNEGRTSLFQPSMMENNTDQTYQVLGSGQQGPSASNGNNPNCIITVNSNLNFSRQPSQNEGSTSLFQPSVIENNTDHTYQVLGIGPREPSAINVNDPNCSVMGNYERIPPYQAGPRHFSYEMQSFSNNENAAYNPEPHTKATVQPYNPKPHTDVTVQPYNPELHAIIQPYNLEPHTSAMQPFNPEPHTNATMQPFNPEPLTNAAMQSYNPEPLTNAAMQPYNPEPLTNAAIQPYNPEPLTNAAMQPYNPDPHTNAPMQPINPEPHTNAAMQPFNPEPHTNAALQPFNLEPHTNATLQPFHPEPHSNATLQPFHPEPHTNATLQPFEPELHTNETLQPFNLEPDTNATLQPFHSETHTNATLQPFNHEPHTNATLQPFQPESHTNATLQPLHPEPYTNTTLQPSLELPQLENLNIYSELGMTNEVTCNISNLYFDNQMQANLCEQQQQGEGANTSFELPAVNIATELNEILSLDDNAFWTFLNTNQGHSNGETSNSLTTPEMNPPVLHLNPNQNQTLSLEDNVNWTLVNINQGHFSGETSNALTTPEMNFPVSNIKPNQNQAQDVPNFIDGSSLNQPESFNDFLSSLFNDDMN